MAGAASGHAAWVWGFLQGYGSTSLSLLCLFCWRLWHGLLGAARCLFFSQHEQMSLRSHRTQSRALPVRESLLLSFCCFKAACLQVRQAEAGLPSDVAKILPQ